MAIEIPMRLRGIDLREDGAAESVPEGLGELFWMANGPISMAVLFSEKPSEDAVTEAVGWAVRIAELMPGVRVAAVHDELVSISDIAVRASVAPEAARMWANGKRRAAKCPFPPPRQAVGGSAGGKTMSLYAWREVVAWAREALGRDHEEGVEYLTDAQLADLNARLARVDPQPSATAAGTAPATKSRESRTRREEARSVPGATGQVPVQHPR